MILGLGHGLGFGGRVPASALPRVETALPSYLASAFAGADKWYGVVGYGQSLALGAQGVPVLSASQPYANRTFTAGPKTTLTSNVFGGTNQSDMNTSKLLVEDTGNGDNSGIPRGETMLSGSVNGAVELAIAEDGADPSNIVWFASTAGKGDTIISLLSKGAAWYQNIVDHVTKANALAVAAGKTLYIVAVEWAQSEANSATSRSSYKSTANTLFNDLQADIMVITGQVKRPHVLVYQTTYDVASGGGPALALLDLANEREDVHLAAPIYDLPFDADNVHLTNLGYVRMGRRFSRALKDILNDSIFPQHVNPISVTHDAGAKTVTVQFAVPRGPLAFDTTTMEATQDMGFSVKSDSGLATLTNVALSGADTVVLTYSGTLGTNPVVRYALDRVAPSQPSTKGSGNLRDSDPQTYVQDGATYRNWRVCPAFEVPFGYAFVENPEKIVNGDMSSATGWTLGTNLSISGGLLTATSTGSARLATQALTYMNVGATYTLIFEIVSISGGSVQVRWEGATRPTTYTTVGVHSVDLPAAQAAHSGGLSFSSSFAGSVDNVSLKRKVA